MFRLRYWLPASLYMGFIFFLSSQSGAPLPEWFFGQDKVLHVVLYVPLGFLMAYGLAHSGVKRNIAPCASLLALLYGLTDEFHQLSVPGRDASAFDLIADVVGAFIGSYIYVKQRRWRAAGEQAEYERRRS